MAFLYPIKESNAQTYKYDIVKSDKTIGLLVAKKVIDGTQVYYNLTSETAFKVIFTIRVNYDLEEGYKNGVLVSGRAVSKLSGKIQRESIVKKREGYYKVETVSDIVRIAKDEIRYSIPEIYFSEPKESTEVFSQIFAQYLQYEKVAEHKFVLHSEDGKNTYYYENGICTLVEVSRPYANFRLVLKK